jgi:hypothetical protein
VNGMLCSSSIPTGRYPYLPTVICPSPPHTDTVSQPQHPCSCLLYDTWVPEPLVYVCCNAGCRCLCHALQQLEQHSSCEPLVSQGGPVCLTLCSLCFCSCLCSPSGPAMLRGTCTHWTSIQWEAATTHLTAKITKHTHLSLSSPIPSGNPFPGVVALYGPLVAWETSRLYLL